MFFHKNSPKKFNCYDNMLILFFLWISSDFDGIPWSHACEDLDCLKNEDQQTMRDEISKMKK